MPRAALEELVGEVVTVTGTVAIVLPFATISSWRPLPPLTWAVKPAPGP